MSFKIFILFTIVSLTIVHSDEIIEESLKERRDGPIFVNDKMLKEKVNEGIEELRRAKAKGEQRERENNSLAYLAEEIVKDSGDYELQSKMDILYDNHSDLARELKFVPFTFNCGKDFDIYKLLELVKSHANITTEAPKCIEDLESSWESKGSSKGTSAPKSGNLNEVSQNIISNTNSNENFYYTSTVRNIIYSSSPQSIATFKNTKKVSQLNPSSLVPLLSHSKPSNMIQVIKMDNNKPIKSYYKGQFETNDPSSEASVEKLIPEGKRRAEASGQEEISKKPILKTDVNLNMNNNESWNERNNSTSEN